MSARSAVLGYLRRPPVCYVHPDDVVGEAIARCYGFTPVSHSYAPDILYMRDGLVSLFTEKDDLLKDHQLLAFMIARSREDPIAFDACELAVRRCEDRGCALPVALMQFSRECRTGARRRPAVRSEKSTNYARNASICGAIALAMQLDASLKATRNIASPPVSACDLVSDCLLELRQPLGYKAVETIWNNRASFLS